VGAYPVHDRDNNGDRPSPTTRRSWLIGVSTANTLAALVGPGPRSVRFASFINAGGLHPGGSAEDASGNALRKVALIP